VADWLLLLVGAGITGCAIAYIMAVPRRWMLLPFLLAPCGVATVIHSLGLVSLRDSEPGSTAMAVLLCGTGLSAGYWLASASLPLYRHLEPGSHGPSGRVTSSEGAVAVVLSFAVPERYRMSSTASHIRHLHESDALTIPTSALPFVFLSERARYRAVGDYLPARASTYAIAEQMEALLSDTSFRAVVVAFADGSPTLRQSVIAALDAGARAVSVVTLGPDGSLPAREAMLDLESPGDRESLPVTCAASIWHSEGLAGRLVERILDTTLGARPEDVGVALVGEGQPAAWEEFDQGWRERENYFNQRVRLLLTEHGIREQHVRTAWLEWQTPDVTEAVRHLAAIGCTRIVVAPSTIPWVGLSSALDLEHMVTSAHVGEQVRTVTLSPWGDDQALAAAAAAAILQGTPVR